MLVGYASKLFIFHRFSNHFLSIILTGATKADIAFKTDSNDELTVEAIDPKTKASAMIVIERPNTFKQNEIEKMSLELSMIDSNKRSKRECDENATKNECVSENEDFTENEDAMENESATENTSEEPIVPRSVYGEHFCIKSQKELDLIEEE